MLKHGDNYPKISILMTVFNNAPYLRAAVESMLAQTFADFEFVIIDDGSTDGSRQILAEYAALDQRVKLSRNDRNLGIVFSLNRGLEECHGEYIARMDSDDISRPDRLQRQLQVMAAEPDLVVLGAALRYIDANGRDLQTERKAPAGRSLLAGNPLFHPTVLIRRRALVEHGFRYREAYRYAEDYYLWLQLSRVGRVKSCQEVLLHYRISGSASRIQNLKKMLLATLRVKWAGVVGLGLRPTSQDCGRFILEAALLLLPAALVFRIYERLTFGQRVQLKPCNLSAAPPLRRFDKLSDRGLGTTVDECRRSLSLSKRGAGPLVQIRGTAERLQAGGFGTLAAGPVNGCQTSGNTLMPKILVIIPAYNEERRIAQVVRSVQRIVPTYDILVINDRSLDHTAAEARAAGARVVSHQVNMGYGVTIQTGYKYAEAKGYDFVVQIDGDGQHDPAYIPALLAPVLAGETDFALGSRFLGVESYAPTLARRIGMAMFRRVVSLITGRQITDCTSGYQAFNRQVSRFFTTEVFPCDYPDADMLITLHLAGFSIREVPVRMHANEQGQSIHSGLKPIYYIFKMLLSIFVTLLRSHRTYRRL